MFHMEKRSRNMLIIIIIIIITSRLSVTHDHCLTVNRCIVFGTLSVATDPHTKFTAYPTVTTYQDDTINQW